jgi:AraC family transcriptional regulator, regulatory protein of adaptative response / DNA-3-methyladenine glycosylase II
LGKSRGVIFLEPADGFQINVDLSVSLLPALMPLLARLRHLLDLDAEPQAIDAHLAESGLAELVAERPGLRLPGAFDGFEVAMRELLGTELLQRLSRELGEPIDTGIESLDRLTPSAERVAQADAEFFSRLGVPHQQAEALTALAAVGARI